MEFVKVMEIRSRICKTFREIECCNACPLSTINNKHALLCTDFILKFPSSAEKVLEEWDKEHPVKSIRDDFYEKFPKARVREDGLTPRVCAHDLGYVGSCPYSIQNCKKCWQTPMED